MTSPAEPNSRRIIIASDRPASRRGAGVLIAAVAKLLRVAGRAQEMDIILGFRPTDTTKSINLPMVNSKTLARVLAHPPGLYTQYEAGPPSVPSSSAVPYGHRLLARPDRPGDWVEEAPMETVVGLDRGDEVGRTGQD